MKRWLGVLAAVAILLLCASPAWADATQVTFSSGSSLGTFTYNSSTGDFTVTEPISSGTENGVPFTAVATLTLTGLVPTSFGKTGATFGPGGDLKITGTTSLGVSGTLLDTSLSSGTLVIIPATKKTPGSGSFTATIFFDAGTVFNSPFFTNNGVNSETLAITLKGKNTVTSSGSVVNGSFSEPGGFALFGTGLLGLVGLVRKKLSA